ncbi:MAG: HAMP domain-containing histidine kinase [candidate division Zixibacteria bacterium]|nr:HAMP domain-containing histidine kinase [candidate division Zixibacteria bacterium]
MVNNNNNINVKSSIGFRRSFSSLFFKLAIFFGVVILAFVYFFYSQYVISQLKEDSKRVVSAYARLWGLVASEAATGAEIDLIFEEVIKKSNFPIIVTSPEGEPQAWRGVGILWNDTTFEAKTKLIKLVKKMDLEKEPVPIYYGEEKELINYLHYGDSMLISQLKIMPFLEIGLLIVVVWVGFVSFRNMQKSEKRSIWVGMAKETAHQLGTPISSLLGWVELLKSGPAKRDEYLEKMGMDLKRLDKIACRFSQIGSLPELKEVELNKIVKEVVSYYKERIPEKVELKENLSESIAIEVNPELLSWVIENLLKNSVEALEPQNGRIEICTGQDKDKKRAYILVSDNGKGIPAREHKRIFSPGYTTKKRGWGLGLTLAKRIVEEYHRGKLTLVESIPNQKTTFSVTLPLRSKNSKELA